MSLANRISNAWNAFLNKEDTSKYDYRGSYATNPDKPQLTLGNDKSQITPILTRIAVDCASIDIKHVRVDDQGRYLEDMDSGLNNCLTVSANIDQTGRSFIEDAVLTMLDEGHVVLVPVDTDKNPNTNDSFDIETMRVGRVKEWYPSSVKVELYNDRIGERKEIVLSKKAVGIVQNPMYSIMNEKNSVQQRLVRKLALMDHIESMQGSGKLDMIIQLPYVIRTEAKQKQADMRRKDIEDQLNNSKYGIAYIDGTEKITQLNRPVENTLPAQVTELTNQLFSQLGMTEGILNGTADENTMTNYYSRIIEPIMCALAEEMTRKFLTKTARTQRQMISFFRNPFKLVPISKLADLADRFTRNEIMSSNEIRQIVGLKPSQDPKADMLMNKNINQQASMNPYEEPVQNDQFNQQNYYEEEEENGEY